MEALVEQLIELHASSETFRIAFRTKCVISFISTMKVYMPRASQLNHLANELDIRLSDKLLHLTMMLTLDTSMAPPLMNQVSCSKAIEGPRLTRITISSR